MKISPIETRSRIPLLVAFGVVLLLMVAGPQSIHAQQWTGPDGNGNISSTNSGNVGIGTSSPSARLHVSNGASGVTPSTLAQGVIESNGPGGLQILNPDNQIARVMLGTPSSSNGLGISAMLRWDYTNKNFDVATDQTNGYIRFLTGTFIERMRIDNSGNVGIGTTSPSGKLAVIGGDSMPDDTVTLGVPTNSLYGPSVKLDGTNSSGGHSWSIASTGSNNGGGPGKLRFYDLTAGALRMILDTNGNVGIGTTAPNYRLDVESNAQWTARFKKTDATHGGIIVESAANYNPNVALSVNGTIKWYMNSNVANGDSLQFWESTGNNPRLTLTQGGNVGIGQFNPTYKLDVNGTAHVSGNMTVDGNLAAKYQDVAEWVPSSEQLAAGTVVVLDATKSNHVISSTQSYDTRVAGVVSEQPGITLGEKSDSKVLVATTGRVRVKVDATKSPILIGDLLVTSDIPGVAMKSEPIEMGGRKMHMPGTLIGKALEPLEKGSGEILVLLSLQ